ncbi:MAG TPA: hypothetical protein VHU91_01200 [Mycobacteriales bacterium]|jgi:uncharacterized membrane protein YidH (DUF202 family)|nr:hypothetical protein [Mycobacteriales bacterium]
MSAGAAVLVVIGAVVILAALGTLFNAAAIADWSNNLKSPWRSNVRNTRGMWIAVSLILIVIGA